MRSKSYRSLSEGKAYLIKVSRNLNLFYEIVDNNWNDIIDSFTRLSNTCTLSLNEN
jgi:hypothetical protein